MLYNLVREHIVSENNLLEKYKDRKKCYYLYTYKKNCIFNFKLKKIGEKGV